MTARLRAAILDDYQKAALDVTDWSPLAVRVEFDVFHEHIAAHDGLVARLAPHVNKATLSSEGQLALAAPGGGHLRADLHGPAHTEQ
ncbi:MAG: hypothetical protein ACRDVZ_06990 [Jiangellaceae bacterium]